MAPLFSKADINKLAYGTMFRMKWIWFVPNLAKISVFLKVLAAKHSVTRIRAILGTLSRRAGLSATVGLLVNRRRTSLILEAKADFYVSAQVGVLFLVEMCEPDGSEAYDTFSMLLRLLLLLPVSSVRHCENRQKVKHWSRPHALLPLFVHRHTTGLWDGDRQICQFDIPGEWLSWIRCLTEENIINWFVSFKWVI